MQREHLFKGKTVKEGKWIYGDLIHSWHKMNTKSTTMIYNTLGKTEVDPTTVCEYTGLTDKNGTKIFEGDIVKFLSSYYVVKFGYYKDYYCCPACMEKNYGLYLDNTTSTISVSFDFSQNYELVGNIIDNKELLE